MADTRDLTEKQIAEIKEEFDFFDGDKNGQIDQDEFFELLKALSPKTKKEQAAEGFDLIDENHDNFIDFDEFLAWWKNGWWEY